MLIKGQDIVNIIFVNTLSAAGLLGKHFDYMLSNPPFGVEWKKIEKEIRKEFEQQGFNGRFGPGLPRVSDGSLLFLLHLVAKMRPTVDGGSRFSIVLNGSPLFTGGAGSGESEIRRYMLENDLVEAIIGLPTDMFGTKIQLSMDDVRDLPIPVPPLDEQIQITVFLDNELAKFDTLTTEAQRAIYLLQERRTALISAAVTGQIDMRCVCA